MKLQAQIPETERRPDDLKRMKEISGALAALRGNKATPEDQLLDQNWQTVQPGEAGLSQEMVTKLNNYAERTGADYLMIAKDGSPPTIIYEWSSNRYVEPVRMMSSTKALGGLVTAMIANEAGVDLDAPVGSMMQSWPDIPSEVKAEWIDPQNSKSQITLRQLLNHTSGIVGQESNEPYNAANVPRLALNSAPGEAFNYSNHGMNLAARFADQMLTDLNEKTGKNYDLQSYAEERLFEPLGMHNTRFAEDSSANGQYYFAANAESTPREWARLGMMMLNGGKNPWTGEEIVKNEVIKTVLDTTSPQGPQMDLSGHPTELSGLGWWKDTQAGNSYGSRGHLNNNLNVFPDLPEGLVVVRSQIDNKNSNIKEEESISEWRDLMREISQMK